ncbi:MAG: response regulator transcription factor [bacterium]
MNAENLEKMMTILLVEDNFKTRRMIKRILHSELTGIQRIIECDDGKEAVALYQAHFPDWVLMDINIKSIDGLQATKDILSLHSDAKIIIVTMYNEPEYRRLAESMEAYDYVLKDNLFKIPEIIKLQGEKDEA